MKKKEDFCRESNHFLKSLGLALCLVNVILIYGKML